MNQLVNSLQTTNFVKATMNKVDRYNFCINKQESYIDKASPLFSGQTISAPHMHAKALEYLEPVLQPGSYILDIGSGSGYFLKRAKEKGWDVNGIEPNIIAANQAYLAKEITNLSNEAAVPKPKDPLDEYLKKFRSDDDDGGGYLN